MICTTFRPSKRFVMVKDGHCVVVARGAPVGWSALMQHIPLPGIMEDTKLIIDRSYLDIATSC